MNMLKNAWYCGATSTEVAGKSFVRRILNLPILFVRDLAGQAHALSDMCPHRFAPLHKGVLLENVIECPYHGLRFDILSGECIHNPHGDGKIPETARARTYPVVESDGVIWVWPGDTKLADPSLVLDLQLLPAGESGRVGGFITMNVEYRLVLDNLLDLSHAAYIHAGTLAPSRAKREVTNTNEGTRIGVNSVMRNVETPSSQALFFKAPRGDFHSYIEWNLPGNFRHRLSMTDVGAAAEAGAVTRNAHLVTPETDHSTHYFWFHSRNTLPNDRAIDEGTKAVITRAFETEDEPMMAACEAYQGGRDFFSLTSVFLATDRAGTRCRRIMERLIAEEGKANSLPARDVGIAREIAPG